MIFDPEPIEIPKSYEALPLTHTRVSHYPARAPEATPVVVVVLNRPEKNNAFTSDIMDDFEKIYPIFDVDERVKVVVVTGADLERGFRTGLEEGTTSLLEHRDLWV